MPAIWGENKKNHIYKARIDISTEDKVGVLSDLGSVFARFGINIGFVNTKKIDKNFAGFEIQIEVKDKDELTAIMQKIRATKFTKSCKRNINEK
jgi:GTP pyrophosphokinase